MFQLAQKMCVFTLAAAGLYAQTVTTPPVQVTRTTGMVGIAEGQTAQLNALNPDPATPAGLLCSGLLTFLGGDGKVLKSMTVNVAPGTSQHLTLDSVLDLALAVNARKEIRAIITTTAPVCKLIGTLEIFNTLDGHTLVTLGTVHVIPSPAVLPAS
jgi:hypothetical protein